MFRVFFTFALSFSAVLYGLNYEKSRDLEDFANELKAILGNQLEEDALTTDESQSGRMNRAVCLIYRAEGQNVKLDELFALAFEGSGVSKAYQESLLDSLLYNRRLAEEFGLFTATNLSRMEEGRMPVITRGGFVGEVALFSELLPDFLAPEASRDFANLRYCPSPMMETRETLTTDHLKLASNLHAANVVSALSYRRVLEAYHST